MGKTSDASPNSPEFHSPQIRHPGLTALYVFLIFVIVLCILYILNKFIGPIHLGAMIDLGKVRHFEIGGHSLTPSRQAHRPNMSANMGTYGHTGDVIFCESYKKKGLYNLRSILESSVEILGTGCLGTTYKLILRDGSIVALKRLKETRFKQKEFEQHVNKFGKLHMENILPLQSYYCSKGLAFLVYDYMCLGNLSSLIQGGREYNHTPLDSKMRVDIAMDVACALESLHKHSIVHGNIKSSNIFLKTNFTALVSEYNIVQMSSTKLAEEATLGYRAPELADASAPNFMSDVYSFGVLLMELLTGCSPNSFPYDQQMPSSSKEADANISIDVLDLPKWVEKRSAEKCIKDVFDPELSATCFETMAVQMMHIAKACVSTLVESRPPMSKVFRMMKHIKYINEEGNITSFNEETMSDLGTPFNFKKHFVGVPSL